MSRSVRFLLVGALAAGFVVAPLSTEPAQAAPVLTVSRDVAAQTLYGEDVEVTLTASRAGDSDPVDAFNLTFTDELPLGVDVTTVSPAPTSFITRPGQPTVLVWSNVSDLLAGTTSQFSYTFNPMPGHGLDAVLPGTAHAYINTDERFIPRIDPATGDPVIGTYTQSGTASSSTQLVPFLVTKALLSAPENELLRGVHDHKAVYQLTIRNNLVLATTGMSVVDYLPAGLEFLGCSAVDNSAVGTTEHAAETRRIDDTPHPTLTNCAPGGAPVARMVTTDPDGSGPLPSGVYTEVTWANAAASLAPGADIVIQYAAAIPLRQNVMPADPATFDANSNLDNNTGALTADEQQLVNYAAATGTTSGTVYTVGGTETATAEDVAIQKTVDNPGIAHGQTSTWTLQVQTSEYATATQPITVRDIIPDGLEFVSSTPAPTSLEAAPTSTQTVEWTLPANAANNGVATITYQTRTLEQYRATGRDVSANDSWSNAVTLETTGTLVGVDDPVAIGDTTSAGQQGSPVALSKSVADRPAALAAATGCDDGTGLAWQAELATGYHPGDYVCFLLRVEFPTALSTVVPQISDVLPAGFEVVTWEPTAANTVTGLTATISPNGDRIQWSGLPVAPQARVFEVVLTAQIVDPTAAVSGDITANLLKLRYLNSDGLAFQLRDQADVQILKPQLELDKLVDGVSSVTKEADDTAAYTVTVRNTGGQDAIDVTVWDNLPTGITCADVTVTAPVTCAGGRITAVIPFIAAGGSASFGYTLHVPAGAAGGDRFVNTAGVRDYFGETNVTGSGGQRYIPLQNIDPTLEPQANAIPARDTAEVLVASPTIAKAVTTGITEGGNNAGSQATIGEIVTYTVTATIPDGMTLYGSPRITDVLPTGLTHLSSSATINGAPAAATSYDAGTRTVTLPLGATYANASGSGDDTVVLTITARVADVVANTRGTNRNNTAVIRWTGTSDATNRTATSNNARVTIVEPVIGIAKSSNAVGAAQPGQELTYTLTVTNSSAANVSTAHDLEISDIVPEQLIPLNAAGDPAADGETVRGTGGGVWNATTRTISFSIASIAPGGSQTRGYDVRVVDPLVSNSNITNVVEAVTSSIAGNDPNERRGSTASNGPTGYWATSQVTLPAPAMGIAKSVDPTQATAGERVTYTLEVTVPASVVAYDVVVRDALPAGVRFEQLVSTACDPACGLDAVVLGTPVPADTTIAFFVGDVTAAAVERTLTIEYTGIVRDSAVMGTTQTNTATLLFNATDLIPGTPLSFDPDDYNETGAQDTSSVGILQPVLAVDKTVDDATGTPVDTRRAKPGDTLDYTVTVTNTGTSTAYDVVVTDTLPALITCAEVSAISNSGACASGVITWTVAQITTTTPLTLGYTVAVPADLDTSDAVLGAAELRNTADVGDYYGQPESVRSARPTDFPRYDGPTDVVDVHLDLATLAGTVWHDWSNDGTIGATEPRFGGVTVELYDGAGNLVDTTTTAADGSYLFERLAPGGYRVVVVDGPILADGYVLSVDPDGVGNGNEWIGTLAEDDDLTGIDFGYIGSGSIGDYVWFDRDHDGVQDADEAPLEGVTVTLTWTDHHGTTQTATTQTDASGIYGFPRLPEGDYTVTVSVPTGWTPVSDPDAGAPNGVAVVSLPAHTHDTAQDFGLAGSGSIGDRVWLDRDADGVQDPGEPGLVNVTVTLTVVGGPADGAVFTTVTGPDGAYLFDGLPAGDYVVAVGASTLPSGAQPTYDRDGIATPHTAAVTLAVGQVVTDADFGYDARAAIGDRVWLDLDGDGAQDPGEPGLPGVDIRVTYAGPDGLFGTPDDIVYPTVTTGADGHWQIEDISDGRYRTDVIGGVPTGLAPTADFDSPAGGPQDESSITDLVGSDFDQDFGYAGAGSIGDTVFVDLDGDGVQGPGEPGIPGVTVTITWTSPTGPIQIVVVTDANGRYLVEGLPPGAYTVVLDPTTVPAGLVPTTDFDGDTTGDTSVALTLGNGEDRLDLDFGFLGTGSIGDTVWLDRDGDGTQSSPDAEPGIPGVTVTLTWAGPDGLLGTADDYVYPTVTTDASGNYGFDGLPDGVFRVVLTGVAGTLTNTHDPDPSTPVGTSELTLAPGEANLDQDFGYRGTASVGDLIWLDVDKDGAQGPGEPGLDGIPVTVRHAGADGLLDTPDDLVVVVPTVDGAYLVDGLPVGLIRVEYDPADLAAGLVPGSDRDADTGAAAAVSELTLADGDAIRDVDFGVIGTATLDGTVFDDRDGDGVRDPGEPGVAGINVIVTWNGPLGPVTIVFTTDPNGFWELTDLPPGDYTVVIDRTTVPDGYRVSTDAETRVTLPPFGHASVVFGITDHPLAVSGTDVGLVGTLAALLLLLGGGLLASRRSQLRAARAALSHEI